MWVHILRARKRSSDRMAMALMRRTITGNSLSALLREARSFRGLAHRR